jgi:hypothetical protein
MSLMRPREVSSAANPDASGVGLRLGVLGFPALLAQSIALISPTMTAVLLFGAAFAWIAASSTYESYGQIAAQMVIMGIGLGLTSATATESILSVVPPAKAGIGSAVNDATREAGGTLGVAVIGSVFSSIYLRHLGHTSIGSLPPHVRSTARSSVGAAFSVAHHAPAALRHPLAVDVTASFMSGMRVGCVVAAGVCWAGAVGALALPGRAPALTVVPRLPIAAGLAAAEPSSPRG